MTELKVTYSERYFRYRADVIGPLPTVIHVPGFNEDALSHAPFALRMAERGFECIALQPPWRNTPELSSPSPAILFDLLAEGDQLLEEVLDDLDEEEIAWLALTGFSLGGMFVARTLARPNPSIFQAAAMVLSTGDWSFMPRTTLDAFPDLRAVISPATLAMIEEMLREQSPIAVPHYFPPTPLLLLNVDRDPRLPLAAAQRFYDVLRPSYAEAGRPELLEFDVHQGDRHEFRRAMQRQVRDWLVARVKEYDGSRGGEGNG